MVDALLDELMGNEKAQKSIRKLAATVFTELDQPAMIIGGYIQLLKNSFQADEIPRSYLDAMALQVDRIEKLARKMGSIAHKAKW